MNEAAGGPSRVLAPAAFATRALAVLACIVGAYSPALALAPLATELVADGFDLPVFATAPPGDTSRLFVIEQWTGKVRIVDLATGQIKPLPFLTQGNLSLGNEQGLLGLAFHPHYPDSPYVYVNFTRTNWATVIRRYRVSADPDIADSTSGTNLLVVPQPQANHNGGWIAFGPDGYFYVALGDGGGVGDSGPGHAPEGNAQSDSTRLGKILRLDVDAAFPYAIPPDNPNAGMPSPANEFWSKGLRNPWRCAFDRETGDLYIGDVGQNTWEEIDFQSSVSAGGENYGWRKFEGYEVFDCPDPCDSSGMTRPIHVHDHMESRCSVTGGYVYRGAAIPDLRGTYFFADYCSFQIWSLRVVDGVATEVTDRTAELAPPSGVIRFISSFGEDASGELYICDHVGGEIFRIIADPTAVPDEPGGAAGTPVAASFSSIAPNPSRSGFAIELRLAARDEARLTVFDVSGRAVRALHDGILPAGQSRVTWDGRDGSGRLVPPGTYLVRLTTAHASAAARKLSVVR